MEKKKLAMPLAALALVLSAGGGVVAAAHADSASTNASSTTQNGPDGQHDRQKPAAVGEITAIDGTTITLTDKMSGTSYTVDASNATIKKFEQPTESSSSEKGTRPEPTTISVSDLAVGDTIMVQGTVSGSSITATKIDSGMPAGRGGPGAPGEHGHGVHGTVTAVNGSTITVKAEDGTTYTVDASSATASKMQTISVSDVTVGDSIGVEGDVSGTSITAKHLMDGVRPPQAQQTASGS